MGRRIRATIRRSYAISKDNRPLLALPKDHPALQVLIAHSRCRRFCACREIPWINGPPPIEQEWYSQTLNRRFSFSSIIYAFVSFTLVLEEWLSHPPHVTENEKSTLREISRNLAVLDECEAAAVSAANTPILELTPMAREFFVSWERAIRRRIAEDGLEYDG